MPKAPKPAAYLIAIRQPDTTDTVYAIIADSEADALKIAAAKEPDGSKPRHVGDLGSYMVERFKLKPGRRALSNR